MNKSEPSHLRRPYFFEQGIRFECRQCGACCTGEHGAIYLAEQEIERIAARLALRRSFFLQAYCYPHKDSYSIREDLAGNCFFYKQGCAIYDVRPHQCRTFPFWFANIRNEDRWERIRRHCPGIGQGRWYDKEAIMAVGRATIHI